MARPSITQWDFGELFSTAQTRKVWTVTELTSRIRKLLETQVGQVWITGEITNLRAQSSGHVYFTLKDLSAQISCVLFRSETGVNRDWMKDGQKVILGGELTVYEPRGQYQLRVTTVELQGIGAWQVAFEKLKQKLNAEGLFAVERKRPIPRYPVRLGVVSSPSGAALRDVIHVLQRRSPWVTLILAPCRVQGEGAASDIAAAIRRLNQWAQEEGGEARGLAKAGHGTVAKLDLILVTRGGGSLEDLWAFNEEIVARAIFESALPVISAVGHEIDFTISDFVADLRAATPSAAAELISEGYVASRALLETTGEQIRRAVQRRLERERKKTENLCQRLSRVHPRRRLNEHAQRFDDLQSTLGERVKARWRQAQIEVQHIRQYLLRVRPSQVLLRRQEAGTIMHRKMAEVGHAQLDRRRIKLNRAEDRLKLLSPDNVLARGYSITMDATTGKVIRTAEEVAHLQKLRTRVKAGEIMSIAHRETADH